MLNYQRVNSLSLSLYTHTQLYIYIYTYDLSRIYTVLWGKESSVASWLPPFCTAWWSRQARERRTMNPDGQLIFQVNSQQCGYSKQENHTQIAHTLEWDGFRNRLRSLCDLLGWLNTARKTALKRFKKMEVVALRVLAFPSHNFPQSYPPN